MGNLNTIIFYAILLLAGILVAADLLSIPRRLWRGFTQNPFKRMGITILTLLALVFLALTALDLRDPQPLADVRAYHLVVVLDVSDSIMRAPGGWNRISQRVAPLLQGGLDNLPERVDPASPATLLTFRGGYTETTTSLVELPAQFVNFDQADGLATGAGTDIGLALERALQLIQAGVKRGEILLVTDGNDTVGNAFTAAERVSAAGIPITIIPLESGAPDLALASINLANQTNSYQDTTLRGVLANQRTDSASAELTISLNTGLELTDSPFGLPLTTTYSLSLAGNSAGTLRQVLSFQGVGLQYLDVSLTDTQTGAVTHQRRLFSHVIRPVQILAVGDSRWVSAFPPDVAEIRQITAAELTADIDLTEYDALVIGSLPATVFTEVALENVAEAVQTDGLGLMIINGAHDGADEEAPTVLRSYTDTPIDPLLPVDTEPRPVAEEPPPRQVIFMIDTSGSMGGWRLEEAKEIAAYIVDTFLRPIDTLELLAFTTSVGNALEPVPMDVSGRAAAIRAISSLGSGGGTDPCPALSQVRRTNANTCGIVFISDGEFAACPTDNLPDCRAAVFQTNENPNTSAIGQIADPFPVTSSAFNPATITIPFFEPEERNNFFENGTFQPRSMQPVGGEPIPVPRLNMDGAAITYPREDSSVVAIRPRFIDPVLVYGEAGQGISGVITTELPQSWTEFPDGRAAAQAWILRTVGYFDRDRYSFQVGDTGARMTFEIEIHNEDGTLPQVNKPSAVIDINGSLYAIALDAVSEAPATFRGLIDVPRLPTAQPALLIITESGAQALERPQRIPMLIPPAATLGVAITDEANTYGINGALLQRIADISGGIYNPPNDYMFFQSTPPNNESRAWWQLFLILAGLCYMGAILLRKVGG